MAWYLSLEASADEVVTAVDQLSLSAEVDVAGHLWQHGCHQKYDGPFCWKRPQD